MDSVQFARIVLALSALPFAIIGLAFLFFPVQMGAFVGLGLADATGLADIRAVYGGLQLGCAVFLGLAAARPAWIRAGVAAQLALYGGLTCARFVSYAVSGLPSILGFGLHAGELVGFTIGIVVWLRLSLSSRRTAA